MKLVFSLIAFAFSVAVITPSALAIEGSSGTGTTYTEEQKAQKLEYQKRLEAEKRAKLEQQKAQSREKACSVVDQLANKVRGEVTKKNNNFSEKKKSTLEEKAKQAQTRQNELSAKRAEWDQKRKESFNKLRAKAETDGQKQSVEEYIAAVKSAITTRRSANDKAFAEFKASLDSLQDSYRNSHQSAIDQSKAQFEQAVAKAKADCAAGVDINTVKSNFKSQISAIRSIVKSKNTEETRKSEAIKALVEARKTTVNANNETFKASIKQARENLLKAFGEASSEL